MTSTTNLGLALQATGDNPNTWGNVLDNSVFTPIDTYLGGTYSVSIAGNSNFTPTTANALNFHHVLTGALTGSISYIMPAVGFFKVIDNQTSGAFTVTVITSAGGSTGVVCPQGQRSFIYSDATNVNFGDTRNIVLSGNNTLTGNNTFSGTTTHSGTVTMSAAAINEAFATIASASTANIGAAAANYLQVTGTTTVTAFDTIQAGTRRILEFAGALTLTHNGTSLILPGAANIVTGAGDVAVFLSEGSGNWRCASYMKASGTALTLSPITASLGSDVSLNSTSTYFDGPSIAQGTSGTWFVSGKVTLSDLTNAPTFLVKLWDGTTVIDSAESSFSGTVNTQSVALSGYIASPAGNLRISVKESNATTGAIKFNISGNSKDSTITAIRIA